MVRYQQHDAYAFQPKLTFIHNHVRNEAYERVKVLEDIHDHAMTMRDRGKNLLLPATQRRLPSDRYRNHNQVDVLDHINAKTRRR